MTVPVDVKSGPYSNGPYTITFEYDSSSQDSIKVSYSTDGGNNYITIPKDDATYPWRFKTITEIEFTSTAPPLVCIYRDTDVSEMEATFFQGVAIRAEDLNDDFDQLLFAIQENKGDIVSNKEDIDNVDQATVKSVTGSVPIYSSGGQNPNISISGATTSASGSMSAADKTKLDGITPGAKPGTVTEVVGVLPITVANGTSTPSIDINLVTYESDGAMSAEDKVKLDSVQFLETKNAVFTEPIDGVRTVFTINEKANSAFDLTVSVGGVIQQPNVQYTYAPLTQKITFIDPPPINSSYFVIIAGFMMADGSIGGYQTTASLPLSGIPAAFQTDLGEVHLPTQDDLNDVVSHVVGCFREAITTADTNDICYASVLTPVLDTHIANKKYIDDLVAGFDLSAYAVVNHQHSQYVLKSDMPGDFQDILYTINQIIDVKFDALRAAIQEATDFDNLKLRLIAVLS